MTTAYELRRIAQVAHENEVQEEIKLKLHCATTLQKQFYALFQPAGLLRKEAKATATSISFHDMVPLYNCRQYSQESLKQLPTVHNGVKVNVVTKYFYNNELLPPGSIRLVGRLELNLG